MSSTPADQSVTQIHKIVTRFRKRLTQQAV